ncbi:MAG: hypothetical protein PHZ04_04130 [Patescibacteria group bacterium]|nr:hypothetical protein [Patescibacteria group bacterium]MDD5554016.1 hypothetical protein [Patescibacteria group bacterium]
MAKKRFFLPMFLLLLLPFILAGCFEKKEADTDIWSGDNVLDQEENAPGGRLQPDTSEREIKDIGEIPKSKEDIKKLLESLEKDGGESDLDIDEKTLEVDDSGPEESDVITEPEDEDIDVSDIDSL